MYISYDCTMDKSLCFRNIGNKYFYCFTVYDLLYTVQYEGAEKMAANLLKIYYIKDCEMMNEE
jgi:hypothetical protein